MANDKKSAEQIAQEQQERRKYVARIMDPATYGFAPGTLSTPQAVADALTKLRSGGVNLVGPECRIDFIPRHHVVSLRWAYFDRLDPEPSGPSGKQGNGIWYQQQGGGVSPAWTMLAQIASLCGVRWISCERSDDGVTPLFWAYRARAVVRYFDGTEREEVVETPYDLRDGSPECAMVKGRDAQSVQDQIARMRAKGAQRAETFAKSRAIRALLGLQQKYTEVAADMPFVFPTLVYVQPADPELDRLLALRELGLLERIGGRGRVVDVPWSPVEAPRALQDRQEVVPDFAAEAEKLARREPAPTVGRQADPPTAGRAAPADGRPSGRGAPASKIDEAPPWERKAKAPVVCCVPECGAIVPPDVAEWAQKTLGGIYCETHGTEELEHMRSMERDQ